MTTIKPKLLDELLAGISGPEDLTGDAGLLNPLKKAMMERVLGADLTHHLGYEKGDVPGRGTGSSRNGLSKETVVTDSTRKPLWGISVSAKHLSTAVLIGAALATRAAPASAACSPSLVQLDHVHYSYEVIADMGVATVTGILTQDCDIAVGVQLKWTGYYADGSVAFTQDFWPNSVSNIPPKIASPFEMQQFDNLKPTKYTLTVESASPWGN